MAFLAALEPYIQRFGAAKEWLLGCSPSAEPNMLEPKPVEIKDSGPRRDADGLLAHHWTRLSETMSLGLMSASKIQNLQRTASDRIDAAGYALDGLRAELAAAMPMVLGPQVQLIEVVAQSRPSPMVRDQALAA